MASILFDIGATKTRVALQATADTFDTPVIFLTPADYKDGIEKLIATIKTVSGDTQVEKISGCIAGPWNEEEGRIMGSGNLDKWDDKPLRDDLERAFDDSTVIIDNDAAAAGLGEAQYGAGKGFSTILYMTISTGVGGAYIVDGKVHERFEPWRQIMNEEHETLGMLVSGRGVENRMSQKAENIIDRNVWDSFTNNLALGLFKILSRRNADVVVLGGSMIGEMGIHVLDVEAKLKELCGDLPVPVLKHSELGGFGGLYGAMTVL